jgi:hypothetical protein
MGPADCGAYFFIVTPTITKSTAILVAIIIGAIDDLPSQLTSYININTAIAVAIV